MGIKSKLEQQLRRAVRFGDDEEAEELRQLIADLQKARGDAAYQRAQAKNTYVVKEGDSPFSVAEDVLGDVGWFYELMDANPGVYTFHPGMEIYLPSGAGGPAPVSYADYEDAVEGYEAALREPTETELPDWLKTEYEAEATREEGSQQTAVEEAPVVDDDAALDQLADDVVALMGKLGLLPDNAQGGAKVDESPVEATKVQGEKGAQEYVDTWYSLARQDAKLDGEASAEELEALTGEYKDYSRKVEEGNLSEEAARELVYGEENISPGPEITASPEGQVTPSQSDQTDPEALKLLAGIAEEGENYIDASRRPAEDELAENLDLIISEAAKYELDTNQLAYVLATAHWESGLGGDLTERWPVGEEANDYFTRIYYDDKEKAQELGNLYESDGAVYSGRGFVQLTGRANYTFFSNEFGIDLLGDPNLVQQDRELAAQILVYGMVNGTYTGLRVEATDEGTHNVELIPVENRNMLSGYNFPEDFVEARAIIGSGDAELVA